MKQDLENPCSSSINFSGSMLFPSSMCSYLCKDEGTRGVEGILWRAHGKGKVVGGTTASAFRATWNHAWKCAVRGR